MLNVGIVGAGHGGTSILKTLISAQDVKVIGVCDKNAMAQGIKLAKKHGIKTCENYLKLLDYPEKKMIIEVTGISKIQKELEENADEKTTIVDSSVALLIFKIVDTRERIIEELKKESVQLSTLATEISSSIQEISTSSKENSENLDNTLKNLIDTANNNQTNIKETHDIIGFINKVANQTKMLGFNAAIEANRAGYEGQGFKVVANEIRNLADETGDSVNKITHFINELNNSTQDTLENIQEMKNQTDTFLKDQKRISKTLVKVSEQINNLSESLKTITE